MTGSLFFAQLLFTVSVSSFLKGRRRKPIPRAREVLGVTTFFLTTFFHGGGEIMGVTTFPQLFSTTFQSIQTTFLLYQITRQDCLWVRGGIQLANERNPGILEPCELEFGNIQEDSGRKTGLSGYCITPDFWKNSVYPSNTRKNSFFRLILGKIAFFILNSRVLGMTRRFQL